MTDRTTLDDFHRTLVIAFLLFFGVWDLALTAGAAIFPEFWFRFFHGTEYLDPQALLRRTGAVWAAFGVFHLVALVRWKAAPWWLVVVGGMRLSEIFADWTYLALAQNVTGNGRLTLLLATPTNVFFAWFFIWTYRKMTGVQALSGDAVSSGATPT